MCESLTPFSRAPRCMGGREETLDMIQLIYLSHKEQTQFQLIVVREYLNADHENGTTTIVFKHLYKSLRRRTSRRRRLRESIRRKRPQFWQSDDWHLLNYKAPAHRSQLVKEFFAETSTNVLPHPPCSPDLALCQVIYSQFGLAIHQNDHQARRRFVKWAQNEIAVVPDFHKRILFSDEAHFWLNGYVNKQNCRIWSEANSQVYVETPLHTEKLTVWCALWAGGILLQKRRRPQRYSQW
ncbi:DUF4817 domain-containing protein [Trichonephila clavipes]|nr:DUF4817 domain-containing protein [Trichonephila clavipes]